MSVLRRLTLAAVIQGLSCCKDPFPIICLKKRWISYHIFQNIVRGGVEFIRASQRRARKKKTKLNENLRVSLFNEDLSIG
jgi:hypothetical protein